MCRGSEVRLSREVSGKLCLQGTVFAAESHLELQQIEGSAYILRTLEAMENFKQRRDTRYIRV